MDQQWLDSLSEDWVSQPRSSPPASLPTSTPSDTSVASLKSQSRIPRYKQRQSSASVDCASTSRALAVSPQPVEGDSKVLQERSFSDLNIPTGRAASKGSEEEHDKTSPRRGRMPFRTLSASTAQSAGHHTVQYKSVSCSPEKSRQNYETPEWKRRIIRGQVAYGEQRDLFGPSGLESLFQPLAPQREEQMHGKKKGAQKFIAQEEIPSSPPPYQVLTQQNTTSTTNSQTMQTVGTARLAILNEEEEVTGHDTSSNGSEIFRRPTDQTEGSAQIDLGPGLTRSSSFDPIATSTLRKDNACRRTSLFNMHPHNAAKHDEQGSVVARPNESKAENRAGDILRGSNAKTRTASGLEEERNEGISPILVSRHNTFDGRIDYAALNQSMDQMRNDLRKLHLKNNKCIDSETKQSTPRGNRTEGRSASPSIILPEDWTSQSLPGNLTTGTQDFISRGGFINVRRGGYSSEGSFQRRNLSPSSMPSPLRSDQTDGVLAHGNRPRRGSWPSISEDETPLPAAPTPPSLLKTPTRNQNHQISTPEKSRSSGSPLKLFGTYDTFTNERLLRRLSQFEDDYPHEDDVSEVSFEYSLEYEAVSQKTSVTTAVVVVPHSPTKDNEALERSRQGMRLSSFGDGQLNEYEFEEFSHATGCSDDTEGSLARLGQYFAQPSSHEKVNQSQHRKARKAPNASSGLKKRKAVEVRKSRTRPKSVKPSSAQDDTHNTPKLSSIETEGKRPLTSPVKDPTPKRRRTLHRSEIAAQKIACSQSVKTIHQEMQKVIGVKRKDARYGSSQSAASSEIIASRRILRPRTPTPSQSKNYSTDQTGEDAALYNHLSAESPGNERPLKSSTESIGTEVETQAEAVAEELAAFGVDVGEHLMRGNRKASVTTQDFLDEAVKIMSIIRAKGRPQSGLASLEESESECHELEDGYEGAIIDDSDSTKESFTRPPSREGLSVPKPRRQTQQDPRVLSHLRKFEEKDDTDDVLLSSIKSLQISLQPQPATTTIAAGIEGLESQPPNIRIHQKRKHTDISSTDASAQLPEIQIDSQSSHSSTYPSSGRSVPTGSSSSSNTKHMIAPDKVSHLIPGQVAGMTYDPTNKTWIKRKDPTTAHRIAGEKSVSEESEQDPFGDIPDLTVDDIEELRRISDIIAKRSMQDRSPQHIEVKDMTNEDIEHGPNQAAEKDGLTSQPPTKQRMDEGPEESSFTFSRTSPLRSSGPKTETRTTSWSEDDMPAVEQKGPLLQQAPPSHHSVEQTVEIDQQLELQDSRPLTTPFHSISRMRNVTIAFSSPVVSHVEQREFTEYQKYPESWSDGNQIEIEDSMFEHSIEIEQRGGMQHSKSRRTSAVFTPSSARRGRARRVSLGGRGFTPRAVSRIEELIEESVHHPFQPARDCSLDVTVSTPLPRRSIHRITTGPPPSTNRISHVSFHLSPLPDFTINDNEASIQIDAGHVAKRNDHSSRKETENSFALTTQELVGKITDVEPYEPYWEHIRQLDLQGRQLVTLHMLNHFCGRLEELDVSDNQIGQLSGAPSSIRNLKIQRNCLSGLTAWNHLTNLQYLDVSGNEVESLEGFRDLIHLRELRADNNKITSLEGVLDLDGLISLKVRRNLLESVDFEATELKRLTDLDLSGNELSEVKNLHHLPALVHLGLDDNQIHTLAVEQPSTLPTLRSLKLTNNQLRILDISAMPDLRILYVDRNKLSHIRGIQRAKHLDSISIREQSPAVNEEELTLTTEDCLEVRKLYISGSVYPAFTPKADFLNLQYLELASSGVETLPPDFGQTMPNVRVLNLNFNALSDIRPLIGIRRLKKLLLAGNRLCRLRRTTAILSRFTSLAKLDLRNNPLTVGFYPPPTETRLIIHENHQNPNSEPILFEPFTLPEAEKHIDHAYAGRLDQGTKLRRRIYEMLLACRCAKLKSLDGLVFDVDDVLSRDGVWDKLHELGVVKNSSRAEVVGEGVGMPVEEEGLENGELEVDD
ncbi:MAG: hypothetical protein M1812_002000 [Candelaria pacifica]|nr:MAG: hypothetical protein M1812_002000 [Candelaria pacifica]